jgi:hypothetical protein
MPENYVKLTDREPEVQHKLWADRLHFARRYQNEFGNQDGRWDRNVKATAGDYNSESELKTNEAIDVPTIRNNVKQTLSRMWRTTPHIAVNPTKERTVINGRDIDNIRHAEYTEVEINYWMRELDVKREIKKVLLSGESSNLGYLCVGYTSKSEDIEMGGEVIEANPVIKLKQPFIKRISQRCVLVPAGYDELEECPWVCIESDHLVADVKARYPKTTENLQSTETFNRGGNIGSEGLRDQRIDDYKESEDCKYVTVQQVWCKRTKKIWLLAKDHDEFLEDPKKWPYKLEGFPLEVYRPEDVEDEYYAPSPIDHMMPQAKELNANRTAMRVRMNRTKATIFMWEDMAKEVSERYAASNDGEIIGLPGDDQSDNIGNSMKTDPGLPFDQSTLLYEGVIKHDLRNTSGMGQEQLASSDPNVGSATASQNIAAAAGDRLSDKGDRIQELYLRVARKLWMILKQFPDEQRSRMVAGPIASAFVPINYTLAELEGEFDFVMDFAAAVSDTPGTRLQRAMLNYNMFRADPLFDPKRLAMDVLIAQNKHDPQSYIVTLREPQEEHQIFLQGLPAEADARDDHERHIEQHDGFTDQVHQQIRQMERQGATPEQISTVRVALALAMAHMQHHLILANQISGKGTQPGEPQDTNQARNVLNSQEQGGQETQAELQGQPNPSVN